MSPPLKYASSHDDLQRLLIQLKIEVKRLTINASVGIGCVCCSMLPWVYGSGPAPEALRGEDDDGVWNTAADHDVMASLSGADGQQQQV